MGYYNVGEDPQVLRGGKWLDSTNMALKHHVVRLGIGTENNLRYTLAAEDLPFGVIQTAGTYLERITVATEGVVLMVNSTVGTVNIGDPVVQAYGATGGTCGKVMSAVSGPHAFPSINGTASEGNAAKDIVALPVAYPLRAGSIRTTGTAGQYATLPDFGNGTLAQFSGPFTGGDFYGVVNFPIMGIALDRATSPDQKFRVKLARQWDIKNDTIR